MRGSFYAFCLWFSFAAGLMHPTPLRLLCFGDSLTAGFMNYGNSHHPYAIALEDILQKNFPSYNVTIDLQGLSGDQVTSPPGGFLPRMDILYSELAEPYTFAIVLGGTNDLTRNRLPGDLLKSLQAVWAIPLSHDTKVLALTVPESANSVPIVNKRRSTLNELIMKQKGENLFTLDLCSKVPYFTMPEDQRKEIWDDGTHFTAKGYDLVGSIIAQRITEIVSETEEQVLEELQVDEKSELRRRQPSDEEPVEIEERELQPQEGKTLRSGRLVTRDGRVFV